MNEKSGYLYVLVHPSDPDLCKIGVTILHPEKRLAQHNRQYEKYAGQVVKETGQKWELKTYIAVPDPYHAEKAFWGATPLSLVPGGTAIEVGRMEWEWVQAGLDAAMNAGVRLPPAPPTGTVRNSEWMLKQLEGTGPQRAGFEAQVAADGERALELQRAHPVGVLITDIFMPERDGIELIHQFTSAFPLVKIIAMSGGGQISNRDYLPFAKDIGADLMLRKPFAGDTLLRMLQGLVPH